jgi:hypothetical protein
LNFKVCFWCLVVLSGPLSVLSNWFAPAVALLAGMLAVFSTYTRPDRPSGIPLAKRSMDVLLGRSVRVPENIPSLQSNNNVALTIFKGRYVVAYRQSDTHMPSNKSRIVVASSDNLEEWATEWVFANGCDLRETLLFECNGSLMLYFFSLAPTHNSFRPLEVFCTSSQDTRTWTDPIRVCRRGEAPWEIKVRDGVVYKASYLGEHMGVGEILVLFEQSTDGITWSPVGQSGSSIVYRGGISEVSFEFTADGDLVAIGRNEDGDTTGFGTQLFYASKADLGHWTSLATSVPFRFDSPRLARSANNIVLFARYAQAPYQLAPTWLPFNYQKMWNLIIFSMLSKSAAVYVLSPPSEWGADGSRAVQLVRCFENAFGDCGFFSVCRELSMPEGTASWVVANYSSTTCHSHAPWFYGQQRPTQVFVCRCRILSSNA